MPISQRVTFRQAHLEVHAECEPERVEARTHVR